MISKDLHAKQDQIAIKERLGCVPGPLLKRFSRIPLWWCGCSSQWWMCDGCLLPLSSDLSLFPKNNISSLHFLKTRKSLLSSRKNHLYLYGSPSLYGCVRISKISFKNIFSSQFIWQPYLIEYFLSFWEIYFGNPTFQTDHGTYHFNWPNKRNLLTQWTLFGGSHGHVVFSLPIRHSRLCHFFVFPMRNLVFFWLSVLMDHE